MIWIFLAYVICGMAVVVLVDQEMTKDPELAARVRRVGYMITMLSVVAGWPYVLYRLHKTEGTK